MFKKGEKVKLFGYAKSYTVLVSGPGYTGDTFAGTIIETEYGDTQHRHVLSVGNYDVDFKVNQFKLLLGE